MASQRWSWPSAHPTEGVYRVDSARWPCVLHHPSGQHGRQHQAQEHEGYGQEEKESGRRRGAEKLPRNGFRPKLGSRWWQPRWWRKQRRRHSAGPINCSGLQHCFGWNSGNGPCAGLPLWTPCKGKVTRHHSSTTCACPGRPSKDYPQKKKT